MRFIAFGEKWRSDNIQWESKLSREIWRFEAKSLGDLRIFKGIRVEKCEVWAKDRVEKCDLRVVGWDYLL